MDSLTRGLHNKAILFLIVTLGKKVKIFLHRNSFDDSSPNLAAPHRTVTTYDSISSWSCHFEFVNIIVYYLKHTASPIRTFFGRV